MVQPQEDRNHERMQRRMMGADEPAATHGRLPDPNQVIGGHPAPPFEVVGLDALSPLLMHIAFPASKDEIVAAIGQARVPITRTRTMSVAEMLDRVMLFEFRGSSDVEAAIDQAWDRIVEPEGRGGRHHQGSNLMHRKRPAEPRAPSAERIELESERREGAPDLPRKIR